MRSFAQQDSGADDPVPQGAGQWQTFLSLLPWLWPAGRSDLKARIVWAMIALVAAKLVSISAPFFYKEAVDALGGEGSVQATTIAFLSVPIFMVLAYGVARILMQGLGQLRDGLFARVGQYAQRRIAVVSFEHLHRMSLRYHLARRTGGLARVIDRGIKGIDFLLRFSSFNVVPTIIEIMLVLGIFWYNFGFLFAFVTAITVGAYVWFTFSITEWRVTIRRQMNESDTDANVKAVDSLLNFETVKYFGNEEHEAARYDQSQKGYAKAAEKSQTSLAWLNAGQTVVTSLGLMALMGMVGQGVMNGTYTVGDFVLVNAFLIQLYQPLGFLGTVYREIKQALIDMETLFGLMDTNLEIEDAPNAKPLNVSGGGIRFDHVSFGYETNRMILKDVSFTVEPGQTLAIVGPSGAGKSTISRLLFRFYEAQAGRIEIDGQDITQVTQKSLRQSIGIVPQDTVLFNDTIAYNIGYGKPGSDQFAIEEAARLAQIEHFIASLPDGYHTMVGERGLKLSGGEKQRVAIARTILKDPPILLLDEATSALDTNTERDIQSALMQISETRTTLIIAHRLSTIIHADQIIVLQAGEVAERGTHHQLLAKGGLYAEMWAGQQAALKNVTSAA